MLAVASVRVLGIHRQAGTGPGRASWAPLLAPVRILPTFSERPRLPRDEQAETRSSRDPSYSELLLPRGWSLGVGFENGFGN